MDEGKCYLDCLSPFLDHGALSDVGRGFEITPPHPLKSGCPFPAPQAQECRQGKGGIHHQEQLSPFLNDKMLSNMGEDLGVHEGLGAPHTIPQNPEAPSQHPHPGIWVGIEEYITGYSSAPFWGRDPFLTRIPPHYQHLCSLTWGNIWGYSSRSPNPKDPSQNPKPQDRSRDRGTPYQE